MRRLTVMLFTAIMLAPLSAQADSFASCWVSQETDPISLERIQATRCRIAGGVIVDYASDNDVPSVLYPQPGTDITGQCWYYTSAVTQYLILTQFADGSAEMGYNPDPSDPRGIIAVGPIIPRCISEPSVSVDPEALAWEYITEYIHPPPTPELNPTRGITGLATFVGVQVPNVHTTQISSGGTTLDIYIEVSSVVIKWGDGQSDTYPATGTALLGYPDGFATHVYERKADQVTISAGYDWTARWRANGGSWEFLAVPNTTTSVSYPVAEIVSVFRP